MAFDHEVFPNAPIVEAILDIRVELPEDISLDILDRYHDRVRDDYPVKRRRQVVEGAISVEEKTGDSAVKSATKVVGYAFSSEGSRKVVQARLDGFSLSKMKPYENWEALRDEARFLWKAYEETTSPLRISRIALRYINRIEIPLPLDDFNEYLLTAPEIAKGIPQNLMDFLIRYVIPNPEIESIAIVILAMEKPSQDKITLPVIFDIDVFKSMDHSAHDLIIWEYFEELRDYKNIIFFESLTAKCKDLFR